MLAVCVPVTDWREYRRTALRGIERILARAPDTIVLAEDGRPSYQAAANRMLETVSAEHGLEGVVVMHQDLELLDAASVLDLLDWFRADPQLGLVGAAGAKGHRGLMWLEGQPASCSIEIAVPDHEGIWQVAHAAEFHSSVKLVDMVDGMFMALSPWAARTLRFDMSFADNFHGYDGDLCLQVLAHGYKVAAEPIPVRHTSINGVRGSRATSWVAAEVNFHRKWMIPRNTSGNAWAHGSASTSWRAI